MALSELYAEADIITLHIPLTPAIHHMIDAAALQQMNPGVMLINTSRGALVDTPAHLPQRSHHRFFTTKVLQSIAGTTLANITAFERSEGALYRVSVEKLA